VDREQLCEPFSPGQLFKKAGEQPGLGLGGLVGTRMKDAPELLTGTPFGSLFPCWKEKQVAWESRRATPRAVMGV